MPADPLMMSGYAGQENAPVLQALAPTLSARFLALKAPRAAPKSLAQFGRAFDVSGVAAIEFAVVFPLFLLIILAIIGYGSYLGAAHSVAQLAADAARASVAGLSDTERASIA